MDHGNIVVDVEADSFGDKPALEKMDFQASASVTEALTFVNMSLNAWYWADMEALAFPEVNKVGVTQFRLRFEEGADPDMVADYFRFYSGEAGSSRRPQLIITYAVP